MKKKISQIKTFCKKNNISLIRAKIKSESNALFLSWDDSLESFLDFLLINKSQFLFIEETKGENFKKIVKEVKINDEEIQEEVSFILANLNDYHNIVLRFSILVLTEGSYLSYSEVLDSLADYEVLSEDLESLLEEASEKVNREERLDVYNNKDQVKDLAKELAEHEQFRYIMSQDEMNELIDKVLGDRPYKIKGYFSNTDSYSFKLMMQMDIAKAARNYHQIHIKPEWDKQAIMKIKNWIKEGRSKVEMASRLKLADRNLNILYFQAKDELEQE